MGIRPAAYIMPSVQCAIVGCHNGTYRMERWKQEWCNLHSINYGSGRCTCSPPFQLFTFPTEKANMHARKVWIKQVNRQNKQSGKIWLPKYSDRVCSEHFKDKGQAFQGQKTNRKTPISHGKSWLFIIYRCFS